MTQHQIGAAAALAFILTAIFQPETSHPGTRGIDRQINSEGRPKWVWLNPLTNLALLRSPNVLLVVRCISFFVELIWLLMAD